MTFLQVKGLTAGYGREPVLRDLSFRIPGGLTGLLGANGSGKTTLLKSVCGILPHEGSCSLEGRTLEGLSARQMAQLVSYIPQRSGIGIDLPALEVVLMGFNPRLGLLEQPGAAMKAAAADALARVGLGGMEERNYQHLSEGQKQLCILARTLVSGSRLLVLDEPESALDFRFRYRMLSVLEQWADSCSGGALIALHDPVLALNSCRQLLLLSGEGDPVLLEPQRDPLEEMEIRLSRIYGNISLHRCRDRSGRQQLVMLREEEP